MSIREDLLEKINSKTKPLGSLGRLEKLALQIGIIQNSCSPQFNNPHILVFAGDHGIADEGVSAYPKSVTFQMVQNFLNGGAAINTFSRQNGISLTIIDAGVDHEFTSYSSSFIDKKVRRSTRNFLFEPAMTRNELEKCLEIGKELLAELRASSCNVVGFGEMGIANTSSAALLLHRLTGIDLKECIGKGTGLDDPGMRHKYDVLDQANRKHEESLSVLDIVRVYGGFEIAQMVGTMRSAAQSGMTLLVDGFISSVAWLAAYKLQPSLMDNTIFCHLSEETGHKKLLDYLQVTPVLNLGMRLGEGTGCAVAYPVIESAVKFLNEMASFEAAGVDKKK